MGADEQPDHSGEPQSGDVELGDVRRIAEEIERANARLASQEPTRKPAVLPNGPRQPTPSGPSLPPTAPSGVAGSYSWVRDWDHLEAGFCLLVTDRPDPADVLRLVVPDSAMPLMSSSEATAWVERMADSDAGALFKILEAKPVQAGTLVFEAWGGYTASVDGVPRRLSEEGHAVAVVQLTSNRDMSFEWARNGEVIRHFDPFLYEAGSLGVPLPEEASLDFGHSSAQAVVSSFVLIERLTDTRITQDLIDARADTVCLALPW